MIARRRWLLHVFAAGLLAGCSGPPEVSAETTWKLDPCGETQLLVTARSAPGTEVQLTRFDEHGVTDENGVVTFELPKDAMLGGARIIAGSGSTTQSVAVEEAPGVLVNHFGAGVFGTSCLGAGRSTTACTVNAGGGQIFSTTADALEVADQVAEPGSTHGRGLDLTIDHIADWDFAALSADEACPHLTVDEVRVRKDGATFEGDVWVTSDEARHLLARALGDAMNDGGWGPSATGQVAMVLGRGTVGGPAGFERFIGEPGPVTDIRYVVTLTASSEDLGSCGTYVDRETGATIEMYEKRRDLDVSIVERESGAVLQSAHFTGQRTGCSRVAVTSSPYGTAGFRAELPTAAAQAWVDEQVALLR